MQLAKPNPAHLALARLQEFMHVDIVTQNVDDLHERAGSKNVLHLHGELSKVRSEIYHSPLYDAGNKDIKIGDLCERGTQLRPHVVWFGEEVPMIDSAARLVSKADILIVIGSSLNVYPAAGLLYNASYGCRKILIDPSENVSGGIFRLTHIQEKAGTGVPKIVEDLITEFVNAPT
jgi:NAD-dependent deacetylase